MLKSEDNNNLTPTPTNNVTRSSSKSGSFGKGSEMVLSPELQKLSKILYTRMKPVQQVSSTPSPSKSRSELPTTPTRPPLLRKKSIDNSVWEELEQLYKSLQQKEQDYLTAVEIGKMLLEKNKILNDDKSRLEQQIELHSLEMDQLKSENESLGDTNKDLKSDLRYLRTRLNVFEHHDQTTNFDFEQNSSLEQRLSKAHSQLQEYKEKNRELAEQVEEYKLLLQENNEKLQEVQKKQQKLQLPIIKEPEQNERSERELVSLSDSYSKLAFLMKELSIENKQLREKSIELENEKLSIEERLNFLESENETLKTQVEELTLFLEEKSNRVNQLQSQLEEMSLSVESNLEKSADALELSENDPFFSSIDSYQFTSAPLTSTLSTSNIYSSDLQPNTEFAKWIITVNETLQKLDQSSNNAQSNSSIDQIIHHVEFTLSQQSENLFQVVGKLLLKYCNLLKQVNQLKSSRESSSSQTPNEEDEYGFTSFSPFSFFDFYYGWRNEKKS